MGDEGGAVNQPGPDPAPEPTPSSSQDLMWAVASLSKPLSPRDVGAALVPWGCARWGPPSL